MNQTTIFESYRQSIKRFLTLTEEEWNIFVEFLRVKRLEKNQCFVRSGTVCKDMGFIFSGGMRYCNNVDGVEITGYFSFENSFVTALKSYLTQEPSLYDIKALEDTVLVTISRENMQALSENPLVSFKIERFGRMLSESFNIAFEDRVKSFVIKSPEERYLDLLQSGNDIVHRMPLQYIAQYIGITPVSLSRIRRRIFSPPGVSKKIAP